MEESIGFIDVEPLKFKDDAFSTFKNYKALYEKQSGCQLKVFYTDGEDEYKGEFEDYLKKNSTTYEITAFYLFEQNGVAKKVNRTIIGPA